MSAEDAVGEEDFYGTRSIAPVGLLLPAPRPTGSWVQASQSFRRPGPDWTI